MTPQLQLATPRDYDELVVAFLARTLPRARWTHEAHLAVGLWAVHQWPPDEALLRLRGAITAYNEAVGTANTDQGGYHETITHAYVEILAAYAARCPAGQSLLERAKALLASPAGARDYLLRFYSRERLFSVAARRGFVPPDLRPLGDADTAADTSADTTADTTAGDPAPSAPDAPA